MHGCERLLRIFERMAARNAGNVDVADHLDVLAQRGVMFPSMMIMQLFAT